MSWPCRTEANPVDVWVLGNVPLPVTVPVNRLISASDLIPSPGDLMTAEGGVEIANPADAATAYPNLWPSRDAAKKAMERHRDGRSGTNPCPQPQPDERPAMVRVAYQLMGSGKKLAVAWFDLSLVPDPAAWLAERLGEMAWVWMEATAVPTPPDVTVKVEAVPEVPGGYGELLPFFPNTKPSSSGGVLDLITIRAIGQNVIVFHCGLTLGTRCHIVWREALVPCVIIRRHLACKSTGPRTAEGLERKPQP